MVIVPASHPARKETPRVIIASNADAMKAFDRGSKREGRKKTNKHDDLKRKYRKPSHPDKLPVRAKIFDRHYYPFSAGDPPAYFQIPSGKGTTHDHKGEFRP